MMLQLVKKYTAYQTLWMTSLLELAKALDNSKKLDANNKLDGDSATMALTSHIDNAYALFIGSYAGSKQTAGVSLIESLARRRPEFGSACVSLDKNIANSFLDARKFSMEATLDKPKLETAIKNIVKYSTAPIIMVGTAE
jgi:hypothetical protein